ncbi:hypothetical protein [Ruegeria sp.]|uniref:hypothetical protein n=1 Tax=Ruegeria sp. TaxID=1879320 RepID=UPI003AFF6DD3
MGQINQAMVQHRLFLKCERVPVICLIMLCALGIVVDFDLGVEDVLAAVLVFAWGYWGLRVCAHYDPRLFHNLARKLPETFRFWLGHPGQSAGLWTRPATPRLMWRIPGEARASKWKFWT